MGILKVTTNESDRRFLHQVCESVDIEDTAEVEELSKLLGDYFTECKGKMQGISAIQLGVAKNAALIRHPVHKKKFNIIFNLNVHDEWGIAMSNEGCMSEPGVRIDVKRPLKCVVEYDTADGKHHTKEMKYPANRVYCHEFDHMNGILLQDIGKLNSRETRIYEEAKRLGLYK